MAKAPVLPIPPLEYDRRYFDDLNRALTLYFNRVVLTDDRTAYWDDLRAPATSINAPGGASDPDWDSSLPGWLFDGVATTETLEFVLQLPHGWKEGTILYPHVHWTKTTSASGNVKWLLDYKWAPVGEVIDTSWTSISAYTAASISTDNNTANQHLITSISSIDGAGKQISDMLILKLTRDPTETEDTYAADARMLEFDIHYEIDTPGSYKEFYKS